MVAYTGTSGPDTFTGTNSIDYIYGLSGNDSLYGKGKAELYFRRRGQ